MTTAVTGYQRIQQFSQFFPKNHVKDVLSKKVGKNNVVSITDFLLGNDYTKVESPYLPTGLLEEIKSKKNLSEDIDAWVNKSRSKILKNRTAVGEDKIIESTTDVLRFLSTYPLSIKQGFVITVLRKCSEFYHTVLGQNKAYNLSETSTINDLKTTAYYDKITRNRKLFYAISETVSVYLGMLEDEDLKKKYTKELLCVYFKEI